MTVPVPPDEPAPTPEQVEAARVSPEDRERAALRWERGTTPAGKHLLDAEPTDGSEDPTI